MDRSSPEATPGVDAAMDGCDVTRCIMRVRNSAWGERDGVSVLPAVVVAASCCCCCCPCCCDIEGSASPLLSPLLSPVRAAPRPSWTAGAGRGDDDEAAAAVIVVMAAAAV